MEVTFHLPVFDGPLDLLLSLISKNKVSIYDIPITKILQQYLEYLEQMSEFNMEIAADFVAMAANLAYIKSKMLLPKHQEEEEGEDPRMDLVQALLEYKRIKEVGQQLSQMGEGGRDIFVKLPETAERDRSFKGQLSVDALVAAVHNILEREERTLPPPVSAFSGIVGRETASVNDEIGRIVDMLVKQQRVDFNRLIRSARNRSQIVAIFLAVLELSKARKVTIWQEGDVYTLTVAEKEDDDGVSRGNEYS